MHDLIETMQYVEALEYLDNQLEDNPKDVISLLYKGKVLVSLRLYEEAIEIFDFIEEISPNYTDAGKWKNELIEYLKQSGISNRHSGLSQSNPENYAKALIQQGMANFYRQHYEEAISCYDSALAIIPNNIFALFYLGNAFAKQKKYEDAVENYDYALRVDVKDFIELIFKGIELDKLKRYDEAIACYVRAEKLFSPNNDYLVLMLIGNTLIKMKRFDDAIMYYDRILDKDPNHSAAQDGKIRARYGKYDGPVPYYR